MKIQGAGQGALLLDDARAAIDEILAGIGRKRVYGYTAAPAAVAGQQTIIEVNNGSANTVTAYFFVGDFDAVTATGLSVVFDGTTVTPASAPVALYDGGTASALLVGTGAQASPTGTAFHILTSIAAATPYLLPLTFWAALPPGKNIQFQATVANAQFRLNVKWLELTT